MSRRLLFILILMSACVAGITGLQLYWNYQNYKNTVRNFTHDINEALTAAVRQEKHQRHIGIAAVFKRWMADTSFVQITCTNTNRTKETVFHMQDTHPISKDDRGISLGISSFKESLPAITATAKQAFVNYFADNIVMNDLNKGYVYFYTQRLGDSLSVLYDNSHADLDELGKLYTKVLMLKNIQTTFELNLKRDSISGVFTTYPVNTALRDPYQKEFVTASFDDPDLYFLKEMKWLIIGSFLLIGITLLSYAYTVHTLFSQQKLNELKDNFIDNMTHELNTPLATLQITADALKTFEHEPPVQRAYLDIISYQTEKLITLVARILDTSHLVKENQATWTTVDLNELVGQAVRGMVPKFRENGSVVHFHEAAGAFVKGDPVSLSNAVINVIDNAHKYAIGAVALAINITVAKDHVAVQFADNGRGIPAHYRDKIFERFFRVPQSHAYDVRGYGLGLSYVKEVICRHKGSISVSANSPTGSVFLIELPLELS